MKAVVFNLGCKVNQYESDTLLQELANRGIEVSAELSYADFYVINTCAVTAEAERKSRQAVKRCLNFNPKAKVYIWGCAGEYKPQDFLKKQVVSVYGAKNKQKILEIIDKDLVEEIKQKKVYTLKKSSRTRAYVKIQDGCNNFCSYCIIPHLRGRSFSRHKDEIIEEIRCLSKTYNEIVLTGINLMLYGKDNGSSLAQLITGLKDIDCRIRLGSFYVEGMTKELLDALFNLKRFCPHFHLSLQSGDNDVLKSMNRHYTVQDYLQKIELIRSYDSNAAITTDVIVGYPTETEQMFANSAQFIKEVGFSDIHIFPFSSREGTEAAKLKPIDGEVIKNRVSVLSGIKKELQKNYLNANIGIIQNVLFEERKDGLNCGYSERYIRVYADTELKQARIKPTQIIKDGLKGDVIYE